MSTHAWLENDCSLNGFFLMHSVLHRGVKSFLPPARPFWVGPALLSAIRSGSKDYAVFTLMSILLI